MESFVVDVCAEVMFQNITHPSMLIFAPVMVFLPITYTFSCSSYLEKGLLFCTMYHKTCDNQIYDEGVHELPSLFHQNNFLFVSYYLIPNNT